MVAATAADVAAYHRDGYVILRGALTSDEAARADRLTRADPALAATGVIEAAQIDGGSTEASGEHTNKNFDGDVAAYRAEHGTEPLETVLQHAAFNPTADAVSAWGSSRRLTDPISQIWGGPVRHYYSILMPKDPGTGGWQWHQDYGYHYEQFLHPEGFGSAMLALVDCTRENGCLRVYKGSHKLGRLEHVPYGMQQQAEPERLAHAARHLEEVACEMAAGDILYYHGNTLHASSPNLSATSRRSIIFGWALEANPVVIAPDPTHAFAPLEDAEVDAAIDRYEGRLAHRPRL
jgi:ectoine hydroxylase-related dioxygenase (phytanoyl-CoA dioxygenase family)